MLAFRARKEIRKIEDDHLRRTVPGYEVAIGPGSILFTGHF